MNRSLFRGALALLITAVTLVSAAHAGGPRETLLLPANYQVANLTEDGLGVGAERIGHGRMTSSKPSLFYLAGKKAKSWPYRPQGPGQVYGFAIARDDAGNVLASVSRDRRGNEWTVVINSSDGSFRPLPPNFIPATMSPSGVIVGTGIDFILEKIYPVRILRDGTVEYWEGEDAWAVDVTLTGDVLIQLPGEYDEDGNLSKNPVIEYWKADGSVQGVGEGYATACSNSGTYVVADQDGDQVRFNCSTYVDYSAASTFLAPLEPNGSQVNGTYAADVNDTGEVVGSSNGRAAYWPGTISGGVIPLGGPVLRGITEATELGAMIDLPRGYTAQGGYRITGSGAMLVGITRGTGRKAEYRTLYVRPTPIDLPRPLQ
ncbi:MAG TPA: hypothetical protein VGE59_00730 [Patescibacteria group bacterium]